MVAYKLLQLEQSCLNLFLCAHSFLVLIQQLSRLVVLEEVTITFRAFHGLHEGHLVANVCEVLQVLLIYCRLNLYMLAVDCLDLL